MLKKIVQMLILICVISLNGETIDDRNNNDLVNDIVQKLRTSEKITIEELSGYIQDLASFSFIFNGDKINKKNTADVLATKIIHSHCPPVWKASYRDTFVIGTVNSEILKNHIQDVRETLKIPNVERKCVIM